MHYVPPGFVDTFSEWVKPFPITDKKAQIVSDLYLWKIIHCFRIPTALQLDNSPEFTWIYLPDFPNIIHSPQHP